MANLDIIVWALLVSKPDQHLNAVCGQLDFLAAGEDLPRSASGDDGSMGLGPPPQVPVPTFVTAQLSVDEFDEEEFSQEDRERPPLWAPGTAVAKEPEVVD